MPVSSEQLQAGDIMGLQQKLSEMKFQSAKKIPSETLSEMLKATEELRDSGIMDHLVNVGSLLPPFKLKNQDGVEIKSENLLANGNLVITIFRGHW